MNPTTNTPGGNMPNPPKRHGKTILSIVLIILVIVAAYVLFANKQSGGLGAQLYPISASGTTPISLSLPACKKSTSPYIKVTSPNGGETYQGGQQITVTWQSCNEPQGATELIQGTPVDTNGNPVGPWTSFVSNAANDGQEVITLPGAWQGGLYKMVVRSNNTAAGDYSDGAFTITTSPIISLVSTNQTIVTGQGTNDDIGIFKIRFKVEAVGSDVYVSKTIAKAIASQIQKSGAPVTQGVSATILNVSNATLSASGANWVVSQGETRNFEATFVVMLPTAGTAGPYHAVMNALNWSTTDSANPTMISSFNPAYQTADLMLN